MSNPRRGWLAAGLITAVAVSSAAGWNASAHADEIPRLPAAAEAEPTPPALPSGERPTTLKLAPAGSTSAEIAALDADAAPADADTSPEPKPVYAPKGRAPLADLQSSPFPSPPRALSAAPLDGRYHYAGGRRIRFKDNNPDTPDEPNFISSYAYLPISKPELAAADEHTLTEISMQTADGKQIVEVGWTVDRRVNGDDDPHLFVFHWVDGKPTCYNGCGFVPESNASIKPGATLPIGTSMRFGIMYSAGNWWIFYGGEWIGRFPDTLWGATQFNQAEAVQWFGEVVTATEQSCTDMGNGKLAEDSAASEINRIQATFVGPANPPQPTRPNPQIFPQPEEGEPKPAYTAVRLNSSSFRYGGGGTGPCTS
ncbi:neprosin family prolyl endopeptidase [Actinoplanes sp. NPDC051859]|uniref:neprosin family prolyl endopeptidase n=1 Tax=Actinoplanes sp. NPDC051859 TaxID=3363909 RepID=UPI003789A92E